MVIYIRLISQDKLKKNVSENEIRVPFTEAEMHSWMTSGMIMMLK